MGNSLVVQWFKLCTFSEGGMVPNPWVLENKKIPHLHGMAKRCKKEKEKNF